MARNSNTSFAYEALVSIILPEGILNVFEVVKVEEVHTGFTEEHCINDFPIRDRKVVLHVRRRRWKDEDGKNVVLPRESLTASGTSYSKEFADVLKKIFGHIPDSGPLSGAIL